ncbi:viral protein 3 [Betapolyomavirus callosciuri]|nr:viral protein 3 [Betapolyomavirus callosciuri]QIQ69381.1 viral protein 3 [Betapolyomavirus callosciuri]QIQ69386.1 viral protein 3 [Betapolyomavirus callosciuri]QIQ69392.1 viral protein 3 [Betapolyomavirus callosciuri]
MALVPYREEIDILFPGVQWFARNVHYFDPTFWASELFRNFLTSLRTEAGRQIGYATTEVARYTQRTTRQAVQAVIARLLEEAQWAVSSVVSSSIESVRRAYAGLGRVYTQLGAYYTELGPLRPPQIRAVLERVHQLEMQEEALKVPLSGERIYKQEPVGGAEQRQCPDWLLLLILGILDQNYSFTEDGLQGQRKRKTSTSTSSKTSAKRRR